VLALNLVAAWPVLFTDNMEAFGDEHSTALLGSEWLVKVHPEESKPYLLVGSVSRLGSFYGRLTRLSLPEIRRDGGREVLYDGN
jgi:hypothetical protein